MHWRMYAALGGDALKQISNENLQNSLSPDDVSELGVRVAVCVCVCVCVGGGGGGGERGLNINTVLSLYSRPHGKWMNGTQYSLSLSLAW